ncbi:MAG: 2-methoxy-6-polyprenyl-1,4-benzoquinol methylase, mitochondrial [Chlamydiia bacterium]|nr:2-methoxy-6-polyprenyl-1,4-benzoquinol methylase, mitochondrial [Chlamydiia bacterium]
MKQLCFLLIGLGALFGEILMKDVIDEYDPKYCATLEAAYGEGMMSEGGSEAIDSLFEKVVLADKKVLDIGSGLGGLAFYLAKKKASVVGLDINPWMIEESFKRIPDGMQARLDFVLSETNDVLPFEDGSFDIVCSKGALCHIEDKSRLFEECFRVLRPGGQLVINDWLSPYKEKWGPNILKMIDTDGLSIYAENKEGYIDVLRKASFDNIEMGDETSLYAVYNHEIADRLKKDDIKQAFIHKFGEKYFTDTVDGFEATARAMEEREVLVTNFKAIKNE